nr:DUF882 domain-containing protein [Methylobacterium dankookense]
MSRIRPARRLVIAVSGLTLALLGGTRGTQDAVANGDTRTLSIYHTHTKESATITFKRDGRYDRAALEQLNWLLRDWRMDEPIKMDPRLFDTVWEAYRQVGASEPIHVVSAYRSPGTNAMLRRRSRAVAEYSQHMLGKAMDFYLPDASIDQIRAVGMQMQRGGVGWYPRAGSPFVHLDVGSVRSWPRMSHDQLARLFPDGKTVHLPADGHPLARYEEARAEVLARGGSVAGITTQVAAAEEDDGPSVGKFLASLFGGGSSAPEPAPAPTASRRRQKPAIAVASADPDVQIGSGNALAYAAPNADQALRGSALQRGAKADAKPADAKSLLTAETPAQAAAKPADPLLQTVEAPLPPRRPAEFAAVAAAAIMMPLPPQRPVQLAAMGPVALAAPPSMLQKSEIPAAPAMTRRVALVPADADPKAQLRALFEAAAADEAATPAPRGAPVRIATAKAQADAAPDDLVVPGPDAVATRFRAASPGDDLTTQRFTGSATRAVPNRR